MSNLTPHDVDVRLTTARNELVEEDTRLREGLEDEKVSRIAGDEANNQFTLQVQNENAGTETRLSTEVIHRSEGDLSSITSLNALAAALSDYRIKTDLEITIEKIALQQLGVDLNTRVDYFVASWDHEQFLLYQAIQTVQADVNNKYSSMDVRIRKYENMLQDITTDSIQITMDNGEINMGAWTILSQAREWDLEILTKVSGYQDKTTVDLNQALEDLQNKLPIEQDIIDKAIEQLSNAPIITKLDKSLSTNIGDVAKLQEALTQEALVRQQEILLQAQLDTERARALSQELKTNVLDVAAANADALAREASIRAEQLRLEALELAKVAEDLDAESQARIAAVLKEKADREAALAALVIDAEHSLSEVNKHIDDSVNALNLTITGVNTKADGITTNLNKETADRIAAVKTVSDGLTSEITNRVAGDTANLNVINNYKLSNDTALANVREQVTLNTSSNSANATKISALDVRLTANDTATSAANNLAATAVSKAETALTENTAQASQISGLNTSIESINGSLLTKADASALTALDTKVTNQGGLVTSQGTAITKLTNDLTALDTKTDTKASSAAVTALDSKVTSIDGRVTSQGASITTLTNRMTVAEGSLSKKAESSAVTSLESKVTKQGLDITSQGAAITRIDAAIDATNLAVATKASAASLSTLDSKVTSIDGKVSSNTSAITTLTGRVTATEGALTTKASVDAVNSLTTRVTSAEGSIASQATSITSLNSGLVTTNTNVTAAQTAANNANTLAGGKGKVFFQNAEPAVADRLAQNLWIDTTGNNNTPKRWLTNAWVAVNDKIATDALTAANAANVAIATKADATALSSLDSKVTTINGTVTSQGASITNLNTRLSSAEGALTTKANSSAVSALDSKVTQQGNTITSQGTDITKLKADLALTNTAVSTKASSEALQTLDNRVVSIDGRVTTNASSITALSGKMTTVENGLATKADSSALNKYYTTTAADTAIAGKIEQFNAALKVGSVNLLTQAKWKTPAFSTVNTANGYEFSLVKSVAPFIAWAQYGVWPLTEIPEGSPVVFSFKIKALDNTPLSIGGHTTGISSSANKVFLDGSLVVDTAFSSGAPIVIPNDGNFHKVTVFLTKSAVTNDSMYIQPNRATSYTQPVNCAIREVMLSIGNVDVDWVPPAEYTQGQLNANATAISTTNTEVTRVNGVVVSQGTALTKLTGDLATTNGTLATKADGSALTALTNRVTSAEGVNTTQSSNITTLTNNLATTNTNVATKAATTAVTALDSKVTSIDGRVTANTSNITSLSGRVTTTEKGLATKADTSAVTALTTRVGTVEGGLSTASSNVTKLENSLNSGRDSESLIPDYNLANPDMWYSHYSYAMPQYFKTVADGKVVNSVFRKDTSHPSSCWNYNKAALVNNRVYKASFYARRSTDSTGSAYVTLGRAKVDGLFNQANYSYAGTWTIPADGEWHLVTVMINQVGSFPTYPKIQVGFAIGHGGNTGWWELQGFKVEAVITNVDTDNTIASSVALTETNSEVTRINGVVVSHGSSITTLQGNISTINGALATKAEGSAVSALTTRVTNAEGVNTTQSGQITTLTNNLSTTDGKVAKKAESSAVSNLDSKVTAVDGRVNTNSSLITSLSGRVTTTENNIATKADASALNKYYTIVQADKAITGKIDEFSAKLDIGGVNQLLNSAAARTAAPREYMVYERSVELKAFFDDLMRSGKDFVVSGEISVPVAGGVTVYSGNGSFHTFSGAVNVTEVNKFVRFVVNYPNSLLREQVLGANKNATQSTLEFYGIYDTGRFPTVRNVQLEAGTKATSWSPSPRDTQAALNTTAAAISTTNSEVSRVNGVVVSQGTQLTNLNATLTTLSGTVNTKADAAALTSLTTRVTNAEGVNTSQGSSITKLTNDLVTTNTAINTKASSAAVTTLDNKVNAVGGKVTTNASSITNLTGRITAAESGINTKADASALTTLGTKVTTIDGRVTASANSLTQLQSTVGQNTSKLAVQGSVIDGVKAEYTIKTDVNGLVSGIGLINDGKSSAIGVNADYFYIGKPTSGKKPFMVLTSAKTIGGVTYPVGTWIDVALIANATIGTAHIADASITNAKIKELDASKITAGIISADRIGANTITADKLIIGDTTNLWGNQYFDVQGPRLVNSTGRTAFIPNVNELKGNGIQMYGRDYIAPYTTRIPLKAGDTFMIEYTAGLHSGPNLPLSVGLWVYDRNGNMGTYAWQSGASDLITDLGNGWCRFRRTFNVVNNGSGQPAAYGCLYFVIQQSDTESKPASWTVGDVVVRKPIGGELIVNGAITADKISAAAIEAISVAARSYTAYKNPSNPNGARTVVEGGSTTIYDDNGVERIFLGVR